MTAPNKRSLEINDRIYQITYTDQADLNRQIREHLAALPFEPCDLIDSAWDDYQEIIVRLSPPQSE